MMTVGKNQSANLSIICNTPEGQDPEAGSYADIILISVEF
jgi:spore coat protein U-like protein